MIVTGTYENGRLKLPESVRLKHARVDVKVEIPDEELLEEGSIGGPGTDDVIEDPLDFLIDEDVKQMARKLREIRGYGPSRGSGASDRELLKEAFETMTEESDSHG